MYEAQTMDLECRSEPILENHVGFSDSKTYISYYVFYSFEESKVLSHKR